MSSDETYVDDNIYSTLENAVRVQGKIATSDKVMVEIPTASLLGLLVTLVSHPYYLESTCPDCELVQNALDNILDGLEL
jgi:hypothetical protein